MRLNKSSFIFNMFLFFLSSILLSLLFFIFLNLFKDSLLLLSSDNSFFNFLIIVSKNSSKILCFESDSSVFDNKSKKTSKFLARHSNK